MRTIYIGLVGPTGSGKETFVCYLSRTVGSDKITHFSTSRFLAENLEHWGIEATVANRGTLAVAMEKAFGTGTLTRALGQKMRSSKTEFVCYDAIRWQSDYDLIRLFPNNIVVAVTAPLEVRYKRTKSRGEKPGEAEATFDEFVRTTESETEREIIRLSALADHTIDNSTTIEEFQSGVLQFAQHFVFPLKRCVRLDRQLARR